MRNPVEVERESRRVEGAVRGLYQRSDTPARSFANNLKNVTLASNQSKKVHEYER